MFVEEYASVLVDKKQLDEITAILKTDFVKKANGVYTFNGIQYAPTLHIEVEICEYSDSGTDAAHICADLQIRPPVIGPYILVDIDDRKRIVELFNDLRRHQLKPMRKDIIYYMNKCKSDCVEDVLERVDGFFGLAWCLASKAYVFYGSAILYVSTKYRYGNIEKFQKIYGNTLKTKLLTGEFDEIRDVVYATIYNKPLSLPLSSKKHEDLLDSIVFKSTKSADTPVKITPKKRTKVVRGK